MRDAFGGEFMIRLFIVFIVIYVVFISLALNYAKAFKVKNLVIGYLEDNEITNIENMSAVAKTAMIDYFQKEIVGGLNYIRPTNISCLSEEKCLNFEDIGISIKEVKPTSTHTNKKGVYYKVTTYFGYDLRFFNLLLAQDGNKEDDKTLGVWQISGETRLILSE